MENKNDAGTAGSKLLLAILIDPLRAAVPVVYVASFFVYFSFAYSVLKRYGVTYVVCSIMLSLCSFSLFYALVTSGVIDVVGLLGSIGVTLRGRSERAGAVGLAYAMHKMASPIRFPPTVALTAVVARRRARLQTMASARSA